MYFWIYSFAIFVFVAVLPVRTTPTHDKIHITPSHAELVRYVNDSYILTCHGHRGTKVRWLNPSGEPVPENVGRVHVEARDVIAPGAQAIVFEQINTYDKGTWTCSSEDKKIKKSFKLIVFEPISFVDTPDVQSAKEEKDATIRCEVKGNPEPLISWQLNGQPIILPNSRYEKLADGLLIRKVSLHDQGEYTCKAYQLSTAISSVLEQSITLNIQHKPRPVSQQRARVEQAYGFISGVVNLTCEAIANPPADFTWLRNKQKVISNVMTIFPGEHVSALQVPVNDEKAFGDYTCRATNPLGTLDKVFNLQEGVKPDPPNHWELRGANSDTLDIEINSATPANVDMEEDLMHQIIGYRFQFTTLKEWQEGDESWSNAKKMDFGVADGATYLLPGLTHDTAYVVRVASRNAAGHSDYSTYQEFRTSRLQPHGVSSNSADYQPYMLLVITIALVVFTLCQ